MAFCGAFFYKRRIKEALYTYTEKQSGASSGCSYHTSNSLSSCFSQSKGRDEQENLQAQQDQQHTFVHGLMRRRETHRYYIVSAKQPRGRGCRDRIPEFYTPWMTSVRNLNPVPKLNVSIANFCKLQTFWNLYLPHVFPRVVLWRKVTQLLHIHSIYLCTNTNFVMRFPMNMYCPRWICFIVFYWDSTLEMTFKVHLSLAYPTPLPTVWFINHL